MRKDAIQFNTLLVPVDFSEASSAALDHALRLANDDSPVLILLHVIDTSLVQLAAMHGLCTEQEARQRMRQYALEQLEECKRRAQEGVEVDTMVSEGIPFLEILRKAEDFAVDVIVIGKVGMRATPEKLLFGSTAEKVIRAATRPVLVLPIGH